MRRYVTRPRVIAAAVLAAVLAIALGGVLIARGDGREPAAERPAVTTTTEPVPVAPLTGLPDPGGAAARRPAVTVKIDNTQAEGAKYGVDQADVVYEEVVEGGITRLAAIFNSHAPDVVGPVRSVRRTDQSLVWPIGGVFAYSGGAQYALDSIDTAPVVQLDETRAGDMMFRDPTRRRPYNLFAHVDRMYEAGGTPVPPPPLFTYRRPGAAVGGQPVRSVHVGFLAGFDVTWTWDVATRTWQRTMLGAPERTALGVQLAPKNVVVMFVDYAGGNAEGLGAEAVLTGEGEAWVCTGGKVIKGRWKRPDKAEPTSLVDALGNTIALGPGQTWVELPAIGYDVTPTP